MRGSLRLLPAAAMLCAGCYTVTRQYVPHYTLESALVRGDSSEREIQTSGLRFEDGPLAARFLVGTSQIEVDLENRQAFFVRLLWEEGAVVLPEGTTSPLMLTGQTYATCWEAKRASTVPREARLSTAVVPCARLQQGIAGWTESSLIPGMPSTIDIYVRDSTIARQQRQFRGARVGLMLPAEVDGVRRTYLLRFRLDSLPVRIDTTPSP